MWEAARGWPRVVDEATNSAAELPADEATDVSAKDGTADEEEWPAEAEA